MNDVRRGEIVEFEEFWKTTWRKSSGNTSGSTISAQDRIRPRDVWLVTVPYNPGHEFQYLWPAAKRNPARWATGGPVGAREDRTRRATQWGVVHSVSYYPSFFFELFRYASLSFSTDHHLYVRNPRLSSLSSSISSSSRLNTCERSLQLSSKNLRRSMLSHRYNSPELITVQLGKDIMTWNSIRLVNSSLDFLTWNLF